jgi:ubiquinol-cytochrome c reductase cytochrome b subunit
MSADATSRPDATTEEHGNWTADIRGAAQRDWPYARMMPSDEPAYVAKAFYLFGSLAMMSFVVLIATGCVLVLKGPYWWHTSTAGLFWNSLHFWAVQLFFFCIFVHFGSSFFTAAWRDGRGLTWVMGTMTFFAAIMTGLTGYVLQSNYDAQWIAQQGKDAFNSFGLGWLLNLMNLDNVTGWHAVLLPLAVAGCLALHLLWVRRHGVVTPFPQEGYTLMGEQVQGRPTKREASSSPRGLSPEDGSAP